MTRSLSVLALSAVYCFGLSACATAPKSETLMTGISAADMSKTYAAGQMRAEDDPVCVNFYKNARTFATESNKPNAGTQFLTSLGISVLAGVATGGIASSGINSTVGQIAAQQVASTAVYQGSNLALSGAKKSGVQTKISAAAEQINCPISFS
ncbi:hypothetical protein [Hellea balneolensis]|uniref:hypothetical protein n=1 Tax=Hellea balneolensis TaxID=287478 RepID=UPI0004147D0D|nr:hypothetical protein [Hellea balneolensis]